jgi:hypothetical protein
MPVCGDVEVVATNKKRRHMQSSTDRGLREEKRAKDDGAAGAGLVVAAKEDPWVEHGLVALLEAGTGTNVDRSQQLSALLELERRCKLVKGLARANDILQVLKLQLREPVTMHSHVQCVSIAAMEILACSKALAQTESHAGKGSGESIAAEIVQDFIETASTPRAPVRVVQRCLLALLRVGEARPSLPRPGLAALVGLILHESTAACRSICIDLIAQSKVAVGGQDGRDVVYAFRNDSSHSVRAGVLQALCSAWRPVPADMFRAAVQALSDDNACVRKEAVKLMAMIAKDNPEPLLDTMSAGSARQSVRLPDACFMQLCGAFFDTDWQVRV